MRNIKKSKKSPFLKTAIDYHSLKSEVKVELRESLVREQYYLCCYCMSRIEVDPEKTTIEHHKPQSVFPDLSLDYSNLLAACNNSKSFNPKISNKELHCDKSKGDREISKHPALDNVESIIDYSIDGRIKSSNELFDSDINNILNLNNEKLKAARKAALDGIKNGIALRYLNSRPTDQQVLKEIKKLESQDESGKLQPFCQVKIWYLKKRIINKNIF